MPLRFSESKKKLSLKTFPLLSLPFRMLREAWYVHQRIFEPDGLLNGSRGQQQESECYMGAKKLFQVGKCRKIDTIWLYPCKWVKMKEPGLSETMPTRDKAAVLTKLFLFSSQLTECWALRCFVLASWSSMKASKGITWISINRCNFYKNLKEPVENW